MPEISRGRAPPSPAHDGPRLPAPPPRAASPRASNGARGEPLGRVLVAPRAPPAAAARVVSAPKRCAPLREVFPQRASSPRRSLDRPPPPPPAPPPPLRGVPRAARGAAARRPLDGAAPPVPPTRSRTWSVPALRHATTTRQGHGAAAGPPCPQLVQTLTVPAQHPLPPSSPLRRPAYPGWRTHWRPADDWVA